MGNLSKGVRSPSANVSAKWPERNSLADAQSLKARPPLRSGFWSCGMAKVPSASTGVSFNNSRRLMILNLRLSVGGFIGAFLADDKRTQMRFANQQKVTTGGLGYDRQFEHPAKLSCCVRAVLLFPGRRSLAHLGVARGNALQSKTW